MKVVSLAANNWQKSSLQMAKNISESIFLLSKGAPLEGKHV